ncbi:hypothetical protein HRbin08_00782 [bacterium HR08]|nr:hypothetical protein HRbin08_00782 [bacterium HR08]
MRLVVDRIEDDIAVCYLYEDDRVRLDIPRRYLPPGVTAGDHLRVSFELDRESRERERRRAEELLRELTRGQSDEKRFKL